MEQFILDALLKSLSGSDSSDSGIKSFSSKNILKNLGKKGTSEEDLSSFVSRPNVLKASAPVYDPNKYYGGMYSMYGGRKVRGGLLGD